MGVAALRGIGRVGALVIPIVVVRVKGTGRVEGSGWFVCRWGQVVLVLSVLFCWFGFLVLLVPYADSLGMACE